MPVITPRRRVVAAVAAVLATGLAAGCTGSPAPPAPPPVGPVPTQAPPSASPAPLDGRSDPVRDPVYPDHGNPRIDVRHYGLELTWDPAGKVLSGIATLTIRPVTRLTEVELDLSRALAVASVTVDGAAAQFRHRDDDLAVTAPRPLPADIDTMVVVSYHGRPAPVPFPGARSDVTAIGVEFTEDGSLWAQQEPYGAFTWFPCSDQPSDEALYDFAITAPVGWAGVASGHPVDVTGAGDTRTHRWHAAEPIATYLVAFAVDRFQRHDDTGPRDLPITYWVRAQDWSRVRPWVQRSPELLAWLERRPGPYPFSSAGVVVPPMESGMETQTMITLGPMSARDGEPVLLHEYAHHWFGNAVTPRTWSDLWLNEGFATYLQLLYTAEVLGGRMDEVLADWRRRDAELRAQAGPPGRYDPRRFGSGNVYLGPALMLHDLRTRLGDPTFFAMLHDWVQHHRHTTQDRASFTAWLNRYTGRDLTPVLDEWLDSPSTPG